MKRTQVPLELNKRIGLPLRCNITRNLSCK